MPTGRGTSRGDRADRTPNASLSLPGESRSRKGDTLVTNPAGVAGWKVSIRTSTSERCCVFRTTAAERSARAAARTTATSQRRRFRRSSSIGSGMKSSTGSSTAAMSGAGRISRNGEGTDLAAWPELLEKWAFCILVGDGGVDSVRQIPIPLCFPAATGFL